MPENSDLFPCSCACHTNLSMGCDDTNGPCCENAGKLHPLHQNGSENTLEFGEDVEEISGFDEIDVVEPPLDEKGGEEIDFETE